jgi:hypothetical protein
MFMARKVIEIPNDKHASSRMTSVKATRGTSATCSLSARRNTRAARARHKVKKMAEVVSAIKFIPIVVTTVAQQAVALAPLWKRQLAQSPRPRLSLAVW